MKLLKHPKIIVKFRNSLAGYRPVGWRYLNKGWRIMPELRTSKFLLYNAIMDEYRVIKEDEGGKITAEYFHERDLKQHGGDFHVPYENFLTDLGFHPNLSRFV
jgi:hypothetical protein